jgi:hypothetical protein
LDQISIEGDVSLDEARQRAKGFKVGLSRVEKTFEGTRINAYAGPPPAEEKTDYCWGGCPGAMDEAFAILRQVDSKLDEKFCRTHVVFGAYQGPIHAAPGEKVIFMGDCANWKGRIGQEQVEIESVYKDPRAHKNPHHVKIKDIYVKMIAVLRNLFRRRKSQVIRVTGCPVSVAEQTLYMATIGKVKNPYLQPSLARPFVFAWFGWRLAQLSRWLRGLPYQQGLDDADRGQAAGRWVKAAHEPNDD